MKKIFLSFIAIAVFIPLSASAVGTSISLPTPKGIVSAGDTILVPVMLNVPERDAINSLAGTVTVSGAAHLAGVSTGGSVFTLWPQAPALVDESASFVGGVPGNVYGSPLRVATLTLTVRTAGTVHIKVTGAVAYSGDGKGTPHTLSDTSISFSAGAAATSIRNDLSGVLEKDSTAPDTFSISLGRDASLYGGQYFITFPTTDSGSGVDHYEIVEKGRAPITTTETFVILNDQSLSGSVMVRAFDAAGNARTETLRATQKKSMTVFWIFAVLVITTFVVYLLRKRHRM